MDTDKQNYLRIAMRSAPSRGGSRRLCASFRMIESKPDDSRMNSLRRHSFPDLLGSKVLSGMSTSAFSQLCPDSPGVFSTQSDFLELPKSPKGSARCS